MIRMAVPADRFAHVALPLQGRHVVVTRPRAQAQALAEAVAQAGGEPVLFPLMDIEPTHKLAALRDAWQRLPEFDYAVFVSPNAVEQAFAAIDAGGAWPQNVAAMAMGDTSAAALRRHGVREVQIPTQGSDTEALLASPELQASAVAGKAVMIFRGDGGRELLGETLAARGARVDYVECYRRRRPAQGAAVLMDLWREQALDAITLTSSESLRNLLEVVGTEQEAALKRTPLFTGHRRIADEARRLGFVTVVATEAGDAGLLAGLISYFGAERERV